MDLKVTAAVNREKSKPFTIEQLEQGRAIKPVLRMPDKR
jgi:hypothetical protein